MRLTDHRGNHSPGLACCRMLILIGFVALPGGCDGESPATKAHRGRAEELSRQMQSERRQHTRDLAAARTQADQAVADVHAAHTIIIGAGIAVVILILLLARERRARRVLERLLRMLLDRLRSSVDQSGD